MDTAFHLRGPSGPAMALAARLPKLWTPAGNRPPPDILSEYLASLHARLAGRPRPWAKRRQPPMLPLS